MSLRERFKMQTITEECQRFSEIQIKIQGAGEMAQLVKNLPCREEDWSLDSRHPCRKWIWGSIPFNPGAGEVGTE